MKLHPKITCDMVTEACERRLCTLDNPGFCNACGEEQEGCEPDMRKGECEHCGKREVYGAEELILYLTTF